MKKLILTRIKQSIAKTSGDIVLTQDFRRFGSPSSIAKIIKQLVAEGVLYRLGYGVYAKTKIGIISGKPIPIKPLEELSVQFLDRMGVEWRLGRAQREYLEGGSQIPVSVAFDIGKRRITRKLAGGLRELRYERS